VLQVSANTANNSSLQSECFEPNLNSLRLNCKHYFNRAQIVELCNDKFLFGDQIVTSVNTLWRRRKSVKFV